jgi:integrase
VREIGNPVIAAYLQGLLLTGARREELAGLTWADVDFQWKSLTIRDKVEGERIIPLTPYLSALLAGLPRRSEWVFSSPTAASGRIQEPRIAHIHALAAAGLPHLSLHGLRRSFGTLAEWVECPAGVVAQIMGHKPSAIAEKHYRRRPLDLLRMWHTRIEAWVLEEAGIPQPKEEAKGPRLVKKAGKK